jgi:uncharacterized membrane protein
MQRGKASTPPAHPETANGAQHPVFAAVIEPHRSLGPRGFSALMRLSCLAVATASIPFVALGLWPVAGLLGLELLALYVALRVNFRAARSFEEVVLTRIDLQLRRVSHRGEGREWRFNPLWTRLDRQDDDEYGLQRLSLISRGERVVIAAALSPPERESFAKALGQALAAVKRGV